ncbi:hypothetical protein HMPREF3291_22965 [Bacillus sp. HMSC76G11]|uniref:Uncharacterized protein n=1 Tax=Metabacillus idriensis TaxID=324768 RepID=A0A6I2MBS4_9BACI|nr:hypothetical protein [Metabacillus idriensis]MRX53223.1 hypothetical protein [Metabacillus idriensis]OHR71993.1 hypothetical protein HMPREF3291_22965 [Bacillus sp. HMSC76G11]
MDMKDSSFQMNSLKSGIKGPIRVHKTGQILKKRKQRPCMSSKNKSNPDKEESKALYETKKQVKFRKRGINGLV